MNNDEVRHPRELISTDSLRKWLVGLRSRKAGGQREELLRAAACRDPGPAPADGIDHV